MTVSALAIVLAKDAQVMVNGLERATALESASCPEEANVPAKDVLEKACVPEQATVPASASCRQEVVII